MISAEAVIATKGGEPAELRPLPVQSTFTETHTTEALITGVKSKVTIHNEPKLSKADLASTSQQPVPSLTNSPDLKAAEELKKDEAETPSVQTITVCVAGCPSVWKCNAQLPIVLSYFCKSSLAELINFYQKANEGMEIIHLADKYYTAPQPAGEKTDNN